MNKRGKEMAAVLKVAAAMVMAVVALSGAGVSGQTHHVVGEDDGSNIGAWLAGRVFRVGDKIWFNHLGTEETIVELQGLDEFLSCNLTNPIRMYTEKGNHAALEKEGSRYFTSGDPESCRKGLKLPVNVDPNPSWLAPPPDEPFPWWATPQPPPFEPFPVFSSPPPPPPFDPFPVFSSPPPPPPFDPFPVFSSPPPPVDPFPAFSPPPPPVEPFPAFVPPPPPPPSYPPPPPPHFNPPPPPPHFNPPPHRPSAATYLNKVSFVLFAGLLVSYIGF